MGADTASEKALISRWVDGRGVNDDHPRPNTHATAHTIKRRPGFHAVHNRHSPTAYHPPSRCRANRAQFRFERSEGRASLHRPAG